MNSDEDVDDQYLKTSKMSKQKNAFYFSGQMPMKNRVPIFRNDFSEFNNLEDDTIKDLIRLYDRNLEQVHVRSDPAISLIGALFIWTGWIFMTCAAGYEIVEFSHKEVP